MLIGAQDATVRNVRATRASPISAHPELTEGLSKLRLRPIIPSGARQAKGRAMEVFIARRPVFDRLNKVFGYKLVHSTAENPTEGENFHDSALQLIDNSLLLFDFDTLSGGKKLFFTFTEEALEDGCAELLPADRVVLDLHPSVGQDDAVLAHCRQLRSAGYDVCAPVFGPTDVSKPLIQLANLASVDCTVIADTGQQRSIAEVFAGQKSLVARSLESSDGLEYMKKHGYSYFEGTFFSKPTVVASNDIAGLKPNFLQLLKALYAEEPDFRTIAEIIGREVSLTYKLLRMVNAASTGLVQRVTSIDRAIVMLGARGLRQWASVIAIAELSQNGPVELISCSCVRGRFCQLLGETLGMNGEAHDLLLMGLFSLLEVIAQRPLSPLLDEVGLQGPARDALEGGCGRFRDILDLVVAYEQAKWSDVATYADRVGLPTHRLPNLYMPAVDWANASFEAATAA
jgi:c-di-GMP-related signal transduction protein